MSGMLSLGVYHERTNNCRGMNTSYDRHTDLCSATGTQCTPGTRDLPPPTVRLPWYPAALPAAQPQQPRPAASSGFWGAALQAGPAVPAVPAVQPGVWGGAPLLASAHAQKLNNIDDQADTFKFVLGRYDYDQNVRARAERANKQSLVDEIIGDRRQRLAEAGRGPGRPQLWGGAADATFASSALAPSTLLDVARRDNSVANLTRVDPAFYMTHAKAYRFNNYDA